MSMQVFSVEPVLLGLESSLAPMVYTMSQQMEAAPYFASAPTLYATPMMTVVSRELKT
jgi:hypothetical protein